MAQHGGDDEEAPPDTPNVGRSKALADNIAKARERHSHSSRPKGCHAKGPEGVIIRDAETKLMQAMLGCGQDGMELCAAGEDGSRVFLCGPLKNTCSSFKERGNQLAKMNGDASKQGKPLAKGDVVKLKDDVLSGWIHLLPIQVICQCVCCCLSYAIVGVSHSLFGICWVILKSIRWLEEDHAQVLLLKCSSCLTLYFSREGDGFRSLQERLFTA